MGYKQGKRQFSKSDIQKCLLDKFNSLPHILQNYAYTILDVHRNNCTAINQIIGYQLTQCEIIPVEFRGKNKFQTLLISGLGNQ